MTDKDMRRSFKAQDLFIFYFLFLIKCGQTTGLLNEKQQYKKKQSTGKKSSLTRGEREQVKLIHKEDRQRKKA